MSGTTPTSPQYICNINIAAPHMHAHALELLLDHRKPGMQGLDVGSRTGYLTASMDLMVGDQGKAVGIDHIPELVDVSRSNPSKDGKDGLLGSGQIELVEGDGCKGWSQSGPYTAIHVGVAAPMPQDLVVQLARTVMEKIFPYLKGGRGRK